ncbi:antibiotic biosynthesis monooxygenase family protein [Salmonirosea aquatica]|uniref:ABM domain-containing protein n=1 Tax=Salmonirosea aquatica TaxID=2654236 RepID=A0A7C9BEG4_9BACT|nr:hypothetical protein [Cytophagaceae bacterium SJW1-29]
MYARIVQVPIRAESATDATDYYRNSVGPAFKQQEGFKNSRFLIDSANGKCLFVTLWESEEARAKSENDGLLENTLANMKQYFAGSPTVDYYEVVEEVA